MNNGNLWITGCMLGFMCLTPTINHSVVDGVMGIETVYASEQSTFSQYWQQDATGNWHVYDSSGNIIKNAWLCDDAVQSNGQNVWYLLDENGNMITNALVQDMTGNYYSLEINHNGFFGMLRYQSGTYDGIYLDLESSHGGSFAKIKNQDGISALEAKCSVRQISINNANCVYTSTFASAG